MTYQVSKKSMKEKVKLMSSGFRSGHIPVAIVFVTLLLFVSPVTAVFVDFMTGTADEGKTPTANVKQAIEAAGAPGDDGITLTFTGVFV